MTEPRSAPDDRPRSAVIGFWLVLVAAVALIACGMLLVFSHAAIPSFIRGAGALFAVAGVALAGLAGRARRGDDPRLRRATLALAVALVLMLGMFSVISQGPVWLCIMIVLVVGTVLTLRSRGSSDV